MPAPSQTATALIVTSETGEADRLIAALREDGLVVRTVSVPTADRLDEVVAQRDCDIILCCSYDRNVNLDSVLTAYRKLERDIPLIVLADPDNSAVDLVKARRGGARDLVVRNDQEHFKLAFGRELADLRRRRDAEALTHRLELSERRSHELLEVTSAGVAFIQDGLHIGANPAYLRMFGYASFADLEAAPFLDLVTAELQKKVRDLLKATDASTDARPIALDLTCVRADGGRFETHLLAAPSEMDNEPCQRIILHATEDDGADRGREAGRTSLLTAIETRIGPERRVTRPFAIFYIRVKDYAALLRQLGLTRGLDILDEYARSLTSLFSGRGFVARVSEEGFALIVDDIEEFAAKELADHISTIARLPPHASSRSGDISDCEIGYFLVRDRAAAGEDILDAAYRLCIGHEFVDQGQVTPQVQPTSLAARSKQEIEEGDTTVARKIDFALANDQLILVYQPIISLMGDTQENYSVLVRLLDETENLLEARDFIGPAIRGGLIEQVDKWTIRAAIKVIGEQRRGGHNLSLFINLSEDTFRNPSIVLWICDCLREFDVRGNWLTVQFQEELALSNLASIGKLIETLKKIKCKVAVNRFGTSERPEVLLQALSLDYVLLQPNYAKDLADDPAKQQRLLNLATLAREFNVKSIVTGVEDARALTVLWTAGVDYVQGNFLQRPSPTLEVQA